MLTEHDVMNALAEGAHPDRDRAQDFMTADVDRVPESMTTALISSRDALAVLASVT